MEEVHHRVAYGKEGDPEVDGFRCVRVGDQVAEPIVRSWRVGEVEVALVEAHTPDVSFLLQQSQDESLSMI